MKSEEIRNILKTMADAEYRDFQKTLIPMDHEPEMIGVRTPALRDLAKKLYREKEYEEFLREVPHRTFEENQLHAFLISLIREYETCVKEVSLFLPYVDNWATCDQMRPKVFAKHQEELIHEIKRWITSDHTYTVRYGVGMLMAHYLDDHFQEEYLDDVAGIESDEYYVNMMRAWYFATALAKQYESAVKVIEENRLDVWTHNKAIQKARESYRISDEQKEYLKSLKR